MTKIPLIVFHILIWGVGAVFGVAKPTNAPVVSGLFMGFGQTGV